LVTGYYNHTIKSFIPDVSHFSRLHLTHYVVLDGRDLFDMEE